MENKHVSKLIIDLNAVKYNLTYFKNKLQKNTKILVVIKAYGYGSDAVEIAKSIQNEVAYFAVAYTNEGIALRNAGITTPILILHPQVINLELIINNNLEPTIYSFKLLNEFISISNIKKQSNYPVHIKFNTGLNRLGFNADNIDLLTNKIKKTTAIKVTSVFSHFVASDDKTKRDFSLKQIDEFNAIKHNFIQKLGYTITSHMCNTSGILNYPEAHFDMVRLGIGLYGFGNETTVTSELKNVVTLKSIISQIHLVKKGESVGYNHTFIANKDLKVGTIALGYADGISRMFSNGIGSVTIKNKKASIVGNISMDTFMVDITNIDCNEGDDVIVFNNQQTILNLAKKSSTISYEILTSISQRIKRVYIS